MIRPGLVRPVNRSALNGKESIHMARIGIFCPPISGHLNTFTAFGRTLQRRGHTVILFQHPGARSRVKDEGLEFWPLGQGRSQYDEIGAAVAELSKLQGLAGFRFTLRCAQQLAKLICEEGPAAVRAAGVDLLLVDQNEPAGGAVAEHVGLPFVNVCSLPLNREPGVPPVFSPWSYADSAWGRLRNRTAYAFIDQLIKPVHTVLNGYRRRWGLPDLRVPDDSFSRLAQLSKTVAEFDFPREQRPSCLHYLGPLHDHSRPAVEFPYERLNGKPLVYASFGTLQNGNEDQFRIVAAACASFDVQLVLSLGGQPLTKMGHLLGSPLVVSYAPQPELLKRAHMCLTHAGLNTTMEALSNGVPLVAIPVTNDQPAVAARLKRTGAGEVVSLRQLTVERLRNTIRKVLGNDSYRTEAKRLQTAIASAGGAERGAEMVEQILRAARPAAAAPLRAQSAHA